MLTIAYSQTFLKKLKKIKKEDARLLAEVLEKIELFKDISMHQSLKVHASKGKLKGYHSFSVNYKTRILFKYLQTDEVYLMTIGGHDILL